MGILDEAIREHLELKRQHGAEDSELKQIEDEAFGPPARPDELEQPAPASDVEAEAPTTHMPVAEAPGATAGAPAATPAEPPVEPVEPAAAEPSPPPAPPPVPAAEEHPAIEQEIVSEPPPPEAVSEIKERPPAEAPAEEAERQAIAEEPTQHYDVVEGEVVTPDEEPAEGPVDQGFEVEEAEAEPPADSDEEEAEFFDEQSLSDELDQALDAPSEGDAELADRPEEEPPPAEAEAPGEAAPEPEEPPAGGGFYDQEEDVLEETPEFLQDTPEHDRLWFEQKPPKDFDFDD